jgi:hypothetical protein
MCLIKTACPCCTVRALCCFANSRDGLFVRKGAGRQRVDYEQATGWCIVARDKRTDETGRAKMVFAVITFGEGEKTALEETRSTVRYFNDLHSQM